MRFVRYLLQAAIVLFGGSVLMALALSPRVALLPLLGVAAFFALLFFLTMLLREHTESRIRIGREVNPRLIAIFLGLVALGAFWLAVSVSTGYTGSSTRHGTLLRVSIEVFGPWPAAVFFFATGLFMLVCACELFRQR